MGVSVSWERDDLRKTVTAIETALAASGYKFEQGKAVQAYEQQLQKEKQSSGATNGHGSARTNGNGKL